MAKVRDACPGVPLVMYINGNGGLLERMATVDVDVIGLDWTIDMADGRRRLGDSIAVQGNVDPAVLFAPLPAITEAIERFLMFIFVFSFILARVIAFGISIFSSNKCHQFKLIEGITPVIWRSSSVFKSVASIYILIPMVSNQCNFLSAVW